MRDALCEGRLRRDHALGACRKDLVGLQGTERRTVRAFALGGDESHQLAARGDAQVEQRTHVAVDTAAGARDAGVPSACRRRREQIAKHDPELFERLILRLHAHPPQAYATSRRGAKNVARREHVDDKLAALLYTRAPWEMPVDADVRAYDALLKHPRAADLAALAWSSLGAALQIKRLDRGPQQVAKAAAEANLSIEQAQTPFGNALDVLTRGPEDDAERALAHGLAAHAFAHRPPKDSDEEDRLAADVLWLGTHTPFDATGLVDHALGQVAPGFWRALADRILRIDQGTLPASGKAEALVGVLALVSSSSRLAADQASTLAGQVRDPALARLLAGSGSNPGPQDPVVGELWPAPRGPAITALLAASGILFVTHAARLFARLALAYRKPAQIAIVQPDGGIRVRWRVEMLGRTLRDADVLLPRAGLVRAARDVRYPRLALYAGLLSLAIGSYVGIAAFVDGVRVASPSLLGSGIALIALGLVLDFALTTLWPGARGRCRVVFLTRNGPSLCVGNVDVERANSLLARIARS